MTRYVSLREFLLMGCIVLAATTLVVVAMAPKQPHLLVGYGCQSSEMTATSPLATEGSNGQPMYYTEESDFPPCSLIENAR